MGLKLDGKLNWSPEKYDQMLGDMRFQLNKILKVHPVREHKLGLIKLLWARKDRWIPRRKRRLK